MITELHRLVGGLSGPANILLSEPESAPPPTPSQLSRKTRLNVGRNVHEIVRGLNSA